MQNLIQCRPIVNTSTCPARIFPSPTLMLLMSPISRRVGTTQRRKPRCWVDGFWQCWEPKIINTHQGWVQSSLNLQLPFFQLQRGSEGVLSFLRWRIYGNPYRSNLTKHQLDPFQTTQFHCQRDSSKIKTSHSRNALAATTVRLQSVVSLKDDIQCYQKPPLMWWEVSHNSRILP